MPSLYPTGYETYIYGHKQYAKCNDDRREYQGPLHNPENLPAPKEYGDTDPIIMVEPCHATKSNDVWIYFKNGTSMMLPRLIAKQLRDALIKVCSKPEN